MSANPLYLFFQTPPSFGPLFLRLALAAVFFYQGTQKVFGWFDGAGWTQTVAEWTGAYEPNVGGYLIMTVMIAEVIIAIAFFFGILTRLAAFIGALIMGGALFYVYGGTGFDLGAQLTIMILGASLGLFFIGGGHLSIDRFIGSHLLPYVG